MLTSRSRKRLAKFTVLALLGSLATGFGAGWVSAEQTQTDYTAVLTGEAEADQIYTDTGVRQPDGVYNFTKDTNIAIENNEDDSAYNHYFAVMKPATPTRVTAKTLNVKMINHGNANVAGIYAANDLVLAADQLNIDVTGNSKDNSSYGIANADNANVTINAPVTLNVTGKNAAGIFASGNGTIDLNQLVTMHTDTKADLIYAYGKVTAKEVDLSGRGRALYTGSGGAVLTVDSGSIVNTDKGIAIRAHNGKININADAAQKVAIEGDIFSDNDAVVTLGLNAESTWKGRGFDWNRQTSVYSGDIDLLNRGTWTNTGESTIRKLSGDGGAIIQDTANSINIDTLDGKQVVLYRHEEAVPTNIIGGATNIKAATPGAEIILRTDALGLNPESEQPSDKNYIGEVLNALANKLFYANYHKGERNLTGKVEIAEGLTAQSRAYRTENITFKEGGSQGECLYTVLPPPAEQQVTDYSQVITGNLRKDAYYFDTGVRQLDGLYQFKKDTNITIDITEPGENEYERFGIIKTEEPTEIEAKTLNLTLNANAEVYLAAIQTTRNLHLTAENLNIKVAGVSEPEKYVDSYGIYISQRNGNKVTIDAPVHLDITGGRFATGIFVGDYSTLNVNNLVTMHTETESTGIDTGGDARATIKEVDLRGNGNLLSARGYSRLTVGGGTIVGGDRQSAIRASQGGIYLNEDGSNKVSLQGEAFADEGGAIRIGLNADSTWTGRAVKYKGNTSYSSGSVYLLNNGVWTNTGLSRLEKLSGDTGYIIQDANEDRTINVTEFAGKQTVIYRHEEATPTNMVNGRFNIVGAAEGSQIVLRTDQAGLNAGSDDPVDQLLVADTLHALAQRLYYKNYRNGERNLAGEVAIADGLTARSAVLRTENITFDENGYGQYVFDIMDLAPDHQIRTEFGVPITGLAEPDRRYVITGVRKPDGLYQFTQDSSISVETKNNGEHMSAINANTEVNVKADGHLTLTAEGSGGNVRVEAIYGNEDVTLTAKGLTLKAMASGYRSVGRGIVAKRDKTVTINAPTEIEAAAADVYAAAGGTVRINGKTTVHKGDNWRAILQADGNIYVAEADFSGRGTLLTTSDENAEITVAAGSITALDNQLLAVSDGGHIRLNEDAGKKLILTGNVKTNERGNILLGLNAESSWTGKTEGRDSNIYLKNDGLWTNTGNSRLRKLTGNGAIVQQKNGGTVRVDRYDGKQVVIYEHDAANPTTIYGKNFTVTSAAAGAQIILRTDNEGLDAASPYASQRNRTSEVLNALANKLYYTNYVEANGGERNLTGKVEIAEGLTAQSASLRLEELTFKEDTGQGQYLYTPAVPPADQSETEFTRVITGGAEQDILYTDTGIRKADNTYQFTKDTNIAVDGTTAAGVVGTIRAEEAVNATATSELTLTAASDNTTDKVAAIYAGKDITLTVGNLKLKATGGANAYGIYGKADTTTAISGPMAIDVAGDKATGVYGEAGSHITLNGKTTLHTDTDANGLVTAGTLQAGEVDLSSKGTLAKADGAAAKVTIAHGKLLANGTAAAIVADGGTVTVNADATQKVELAGGLTTLNNGTITLGMNADSTWTGAATNAGTMAVTNAGTWTGNVANTGTFHLANTGTWANTGAGRLTKLSGDGTIVQKAGSGDVVVASYSGKQVVIYEHEATNPTNILGGNFTITSAAAGAQITLRTDHAGLNFESTLAADKNLISETLNKLANKLYYTNYVAANGGERNLTGQVEIAEGLTAQSASKRIEDIIFQDENGQGQYLYEEAYDIPDTQTDTEFGVPITGVEANDERYVRTGVLKEGIYQFTKDTNIAVDASTAKDGKIGAIRAEQAVELNASGKLALSATNNTRGNGVAAIYAGDNVKLTANSLTLQAEGGTQTSGILAAAGKTVTINAPLTVGVTGGKAAGIYGQSGSVVNLNGLYTLNTEANAQGIYTEGKVTAQEVNLSGANSMLFAKGTGAEITLDGGTIAGKSSAAALRADENGIIKVNNGAAKKLTLTGDVEAINGGKVIFGLNDASAWEGKAVNNKDGAAAGSIVMANSGVWTNTGDSSLSELSGNGTILQKRNSGQLTVAQLSGKQVVIYEHDSSTPTNILGGKLVIKAATADARIILRTDNTGLNTTSTAAEDVNLVNATLNELAKKLFYQDQEGGGGQLAGTVEIAEGLTSQGVSLRSEAVTYSSADGQGQYDYTPVPEIPEEQTDTEFSTVLTGDETADQGYTESGIRKEDGVYEFTKDTEISVDGDEAVNNEVGVIRVENGIKVDAKANLTLNAESDDPADDVAAISAEGDVEVTAKKLKLTAKGGDTTYGIIGKEDSKTTIDAPTTIEVEGANAAAVYGEDNSVITLNGKTIMNSDKDVDGIVTRGIVNAGEVDLSGKGAMVFADGDKAVAEVAGGTIDAKGDNPAVVADKGSVRINQDAAKKVDMQGDVETKNGGSVDVGLNGSSTWTGMATRSGDINVTNDGTWTNTGDSELTKLAGTQGAIIQKKDGGKVQTDLFSGKQIVIYEHDANNPTTIYGEDFIIKSAAENSQIILRTDNVGLNTASDEAVDKNLVSETLNNLANKLYYEAYVDNERNLTGQVEIAEGLTTQSAALKVGKMSYKQATGQGFFEYDPEDPIPPTPPVTPDDPEIIYGPTETAMMRGAKSAMTGAMLEWRQDEDDYSKRLVDLRNGAEEGVWGRLYGGKTSYDKDNASYESKFKGVKAGFDMGNKNGWQTGIAFGYQDGDQDYILGGEGDTTLISLALYGTKQNDDGSYLDLVLKGSHVKNDYTVYNDMMYKLEGDYSTWGVSLSAEYGKKTYQDDGSYFGYFGKLTYGRLASTDYDAKSNYAGGKLMHVEQDSLDSFVARAGVSVGRATDKLDYYLKGVVAHEFSGKMKSTFSAVNEPTSSTEQDFGDTWLELGVGGTYSLNDNTYLYGNLERSFGGDVETDWRADLGIRWLF